MLLTPRIHFIENLGNVWSCPDSKYLESGYWWRIGENNANDLIGGHLYLHSSQSSPSHQGGIIVSYRIQQEGEFKGRYIFRFQPSPKHLDVLAEPRRWPGQWKWLVL